MKRIMMIGLASALCAMPTLGFAIGDDDESQGSGGEPQTDEVQRDSDNDGAAGGDDSIGQADSGEGEAGTDGTDDDSSEGDDAG